MTNNSPEVQKENGTQKEEQSTSKSLVNLLVNIVIPIFILSKFSKIVDLGPNTDKIGLVVALAFPVIYFIYGWIVNRKVNVISILGFVGILIKGIIGLLELPREYVAIERATIPILIGALVFASGFMKNPPLNKIIYNETLFDTKKIETSLAENGYTEKLAKLLKQAGYVIAATFVFSGIINYFLTQRIMAADISYNDALASVMKWSIVVITVPTVVVLMVEFWYLMKKLSQYTGLKTDDLFNEALQEKK